MTSLPPKKRIELELPIDSAMSQSAIDQLQQQFNAEITTNQIVSNPRSNGEENQNQLGSEADPIVVENQSITEGVENVVEVVCHLCHTRVKLSPLEFSSTPERVAYSCQMCKFSAENSALVERSEEILANLYSAEVEFDQSVSRLMEVRKLIEQFNRTNQPQANDETPAEPKLDPKGSETEEIVVEAEFFPIEQGEDLHADITDAQSDQSQAELNSTAEIQILGLLEGQEKLLANLNSVESDSAESIRQLGVALKTLEEIINSKRPQVNAETQTDSDVNVEIVSDAHLSPKVTLFDRETHAEAVGVEADIIPTDQDFHADSVDAELIHSDSELNPTEEIQEETTNRAVEVNSDGCQLITEVLAENVQNVSPRRETRKTAEVPTSKTVGLKTTKNNQSVSAKKSQNRLVSSPNSAATVYSTAEHIDGEQLPNRIDEVESDQSETEPITGKSAKKVVRSEEIGKVEGLVRRGIPSVNPNAKKSVRKRVVSMPNLDEIEDLSTRAKRRRIDSPVDKSKVAQVHQQSTATRAKVNRVGIAAKKSQNVGNNRENSRRDVRKVKLLKVPKQHWKNYHSVETEWKFKCAQCLKGFASKTELRRHSYVHSDVVHSCDKCGTQFKDPTKLRKHQRQKHSAVPFTDFQCDECQQLFLTVEKWNSANIVYGIIVKSQLIPVTVAS